MKKLMSVLSAALLFLVFSGCSLIGGLLMNDEEKEFIGLWRSSGWDSVDTSCYWDFRDNGRVYVTEWTDDLETKIIPTHFNYSVNDDGYLKLSQYLGIASFEFEITDDSDFPAGNCFLRVNDFSSDFDFDRINYGTTFYLSKRFEYSSEAKALQALYREAGDE